MFRLSRDVMLDSCSFIYLLSISMKIYRNEKYYSFFSFEVHWVRTLTRTVASLAAMIKISAQETTLGQTFSTAFLASSITSYDLSEFILDKESFSPSMFGVSSSSSEASHPYKLFEQA